MMTSRNETSSVRMFASMFVAISALSLTPTVNNMGITYAPQSAMVNDYVQNNMGTDTLKPKVYEVRKTTNYEQAIEVFDVEMREFTKEEAEKYQEALEEIYKPIGVNIFDLC